jgi:hypothetical protein
MASSNTSQVWSGLEIMNVFFVVAANIFWESGVLFKPEVSARAPFPMRSAASYPETASTGTESESATPSPESRLNAPGPPVAKQTPSLFENIA